MAQLEKYKRMDAIEKDLMLLTGIYENFMEDEMTEEQEETHDKIQDFLLKYYYFPSKIKDESILFKS